MDLETIKSSLGYLSAGGLVIMGIRGILDPVAVSQLYGIPHADTLSSYIPVMGARNIAIGVSIGALLFQDQRRAAGTVLSTALIIGPLDAWITYRYAGQLTSEVLSHVVADGLVGLLGFWF